MLAATIAITCLALLAVGAWLHFRHRTAINAQSIANSAAKAEREQAEASASMDEALRLAKIDDAAIAKGVTDGKRAGLADVLNARPGK